MKKLIPLILGLVLGVGGGTGAYILRGGDAPVDAEVAGEDGALDTEEPTHVAAADSVEGPEESHEPEDIDPADAASQAIAEALLADPPPEQEAPDTTATPEPVQTPETPDESGDPTPPAGAVDPPTEDDPEGSTGADEGVAPEGSEGTADPGAIPGADATPASVAGGPVNDEEAAKRVAKIFSQMQPRDAARVLSLMERSEVELILKQLDNRSAAKILSGLSPEQAAALSAVLIRGGDR